MVEVVRVQPIAKQTVAEPTFIDYIVASLPFILIIAIVVAAIVLLLYWLLKKRHEKRDIYKENLKTVIEQCKVHKNDKYFKPVFGIPSFIFKKGAPVMITYPPMKPAIVGDKKGSVKEQIKELGDEYTNTEIQDEIDAEYGETYVVGRYLGQCTTADGCINVMVSSVKYKDFFIFPKKMVIKVRKGIKKMVVDPDSLSDDETKATKQKMITMHPDKFSMSGDVILIECLGLQKISEFWYPINVDKNGMVVDTRAWVRYDLMDIAAEKQLIDFGKNWVNASEEMIRINPYVQWAKKVEQESIRSGQ